MPKKQFYEWAIDYLEKMVVEVDDLESNNPLDPDYAMAAGRARAIIDGLLNSHIPQELMAETRAELRRVSNMFPELERNYFFRKDIWKAFV